MAKVELKAPTGRAYAIAIAGLPVCAALVTGTLTHGAMTLWHGEPLVPELGYIIAYLLPSLVAVLLVFRAIRRNRGSGSQPLKLFRFGMPILLAAGAVGGIVFVALVTGPQHYAALASDDRDACRAFLGDAADQSVKPCVSIASSCRHARDEYEKRVEMHPGELRPRDWPEGLPLGRTRENAMQLCLYEHRDEFQD